MNDKDIRAYNPMNMHIHGNRDTSYCLSCRPGSTTVAVQSLQVINLSVPQFPCLKDDQNNLILELLDGLNQLLHVKYLEQC